MISVRRPIRDQLSRREGDGDINAERIMLEAEIRRRSLADTDEENFDPEDDEDDWGEPVDSEGNPLKDPEEPVEDSPEGEAS